MIIALSHAILKLCFWILDYPYYINIMLYLFMFFYRLYNDNGCGGVVVLIFNLLFENFLIPFFLSNR